MQLASQSMLSAAIAEWVQRLDDDPILVSVSDPDRVQSKGLFAGKKTVYKVRSSSRTALLSVAREYKDFVMLRKILEGRFMGACLPPVPPEKMMGAADADFIAKRMHLLEHFVQTLADNPFARSDTCFTLFLTSPEPFDKVIKQGVTDDSEGLRMWKQALDEAQEPADVEMLLQTLNRELDVILKSLNQVKDAAKVQVAALRKFAESSAATAHALEAWQVREESSVSVLRGVAAHADGSKAVLPVELKKLAREAHAHSGILQLEYGASQLEQTLVDAVRFEIAHTERWKSQIAEAQAKIKQDAKASELVRALQVQVQKEPKIAGRLKEAQKIEEEAKLDARAMKRGIFAIELDRYRKQRAIRLETMSALLGRLHVRGANMIKSTWDGTALAAPAETTPQPRGSLLAVSGGAQAGSFSLFRRKSLERTASGKLRLAAAGKRADAETLQAELDREANTMAAPRPTAIQSDEKKTTLKAKQTYLAKKGDELDLVEGELVTAVRIDDELWYATNASGKSGLVPSSHVGVPLVTVDAPAPATTPGAASSSSASSPPPRPVSESHQPTSPPPGLPALPPGIPPLPPPSRDPSSAPSLPDTSSFSLGSPSSSGVAVASSADDLGRDASKRISIAPRPPAVPDFLMKRGEEGLPPLPSNAEVMAALRAKLATLRESD